MENKKTFSSTIKSFNSNYVGDINEEVELNRIFNAYKSRVILFIIIAALVVVTFYVDKAGYTFIYATKASGSKYIGVTKTSDIRLEETHPDDFNYKSATEFNIFYCGGGILILIFILSNITISEEIATSKRRIKEHRAYVREQARKEKQAAINQAISDKVDTYSGKLSNFVRDIAYKLSRLDEKK